MRRLAFLFVLFVLTSCSSYRFVGQANRLPGGIKLLYVENVFNETGEPNLQVYLRNDLINVLNLDKRVTIVDSKDDADGFLRVKITGYSVDPISYDASGLAYRYRCTIQASVELLDKDGKKLVDTSVTSYKDYNATNVNAAEVARNKFSKEVLNDMALKIRNALYVNF